MLDLIIVCISVCIIILVELHAYNPPALLGIYSRENGYFWLKYYFMKLVLIARKIVSKRTRKCYEELEPCHKLPKFGKAVEEIFFNGANSTGDHLILAIGRRPKRLIDGLLYIKIHNSKYGILASPKLPDTALYQDEECEEYAVEGLRVTLLAPMEKWRISYEGSMKELGNENVTHKVKLDGVWSSNLPYFDYSVDIDPSCLAKATAKEKWSGEYFKILEMNNDEHYEQYGDFKGEIIVDGERFDLSLDTVRAHSVSANREWCHFKRYAEHWFSCENGDRYNVAVISMPISYTEIIIGYVYSNKHQKVFPVTDCDLKLYQHGHTGSPPKDYAFSFTAGHQKYTIQINVEDQFHFYCSEEWEAKIYDCFGQITVNGQKGWGCIEWVYRNIDGKSAEDYHKIR